MHALNVTRHLIISIMRIHEQERGHLHALNVTRHLIISIMRIHETIHTGERLFACSKCDKAFDHILHDNTQNYSHRKEAICML